MSAAWRFSDRREKSECRLLLEWDAYVVRGGEDLNGWSGLPSESFRNSPASLLTGVGCGYLMGPEAVSAVIVCAGNCAEGRHQAGLIPFAPSWDNLRLNTSGAA